MPVKTIKKTDVPKPTRFRRTPLKETEEWADVQTILAHGLKRAEAVEITLSPKTTSELLDRGLKHPIRLLRNLIKTKVRELNLEYDVWQQGGRDGTVIYIAGR